MYWDPQNLLSIHMCVYIRGEVICQKVRTLYKIQLGFESSGYKPEFYSSIIFDDYY